MLDETKQEKKKLYKQYYQQFHPENKLSGNEEPVEVFSLDSDDLNFVQSYSLPIKRIRQEKNINQNISIKSTSSNFNWNDNLAQYQGKITSNSRQAKFSSRHQFAENVSHSRSKINSGFIPMCREARKTSYPRAKEVAKSSAFSGQPIPNKLAATVDVQDLFQKLMASGLISKSQEKPTLNKADSLKKRNSDNISALYTGWQCGSCSIRLPVDQKIEIEEHLNFHFEENHGKKIIEHRSWYCSANEWVNREWDCVKKETKQPKTSNCIARPNEHSKTCDMCNDSFEMFFDNEADEWQFRDAIRIEEKVYHPTCYDDYKVNLNAIR